MNRTDIDMLARHLIDVWGDFVKVDDMPDELIVPFALNTLQKAATGLARLRRVEAVADNVKDALDFFRSECVSRDTIVPMWVNVCYDALAAALTEQEPS